MSPPVLLSCEGISKSFGAAPLFAGLTFSLHEGDHVGLVGPNGAGKSTLLNILAGLESPDAGTCARRKGLRIGHVPQTPRFPAGASVAQVVASALQAGGRADADENRRRSALALGRAGFTDPDAPTSLLSGGWRARLAIARALAAEPDILLLDEPTNQLDVESILWLETLLEEEARAFVVVSHDRYFLENVARRMLEISRIHAAGLFQADGSYADFLEARDEALRSQAAYAETLANLVRREVEWLRRGPKARTTKSKARIQSAERSIEALREVRGRGPAPAIGLGFTASGRRTKRLWACEGLGHAFGDRAIVSGLDLVLSPGARLGLLGPNGSGKTTLLRVISGEIAPTEGTIERAEGLRVVSFERDRERPDPGLTLRRALAADADAVVYRGRAVHVVSWARRFLFRAEQLDAPVSRLSGGERARIVLARMMLQEADLLLLDEPTNDLDIPALDVLEETLLEFPGALVLVTHDRYLLDRVTTQILALDGRGGAALHAGYEQWVAHARPAPPGRKNRPAAPAPKAAPAGARRLSYLEQREWDGMEEAVLTAEARVEEARRRAHDPAIATDAVALQQRLADLAELQREVDRLYARWAELEAKLR